MKQPLVINNSKSDFFEPFYMYDIVTIYDKSIDAYVTRRRATAISFSNKGEIIVTVAICSDKDIFQRPKARMILMNRLTNLVQSVTATTVNPTNMTSTGDAFYFADLRSFEDFCQVFDNFSALYCLPYKVIRQKRTKDSNGKNTTWYTGLDVLRELPSVSYWHKEFVETSYPKFMKCLEDGGTNVVADRVPDEIPF